MKKETKELEKIGIRTKSNSYKKWLESGLLNNIDETFATEVQKYWEDNYDKRVNPTLHMAFMNLTGKKDKRLIPGNIMQKEVLPVFNDYSKSAFYGDKNIYDLVIKPSRSVESVLRNIRGTYFDSNYNMIETEKACRTLLSCNTDLIIKPSKANNGTGIVKIKIQDSKIYIDDEIVTIDKLLDMYKEDFIIQKVVQQHPNMAAPHPASVNTLRIVTFRWKNEVRYLLAFARFGSNDDVRDNASVDDSPRIGITDSGEFFDFGISQDGQKFTHHPTTGYCLADLEPIPNYDEFKQFVIEHHKNFLHLDLVSWDIAVGLDGKPIFIEANFAGSTSFYQLASQRSIFGDLTEEVLQYVKNELKINKPLLMKKHRDKINQKAADKQKQELEQSKILITELKEKNKKRNKQRRLLKERLEIKEKELDKIKAEYAEYAEKMNRINEKYTGIINSKSFRYTRPMRKISKLLK